MTFDDGGKGGTTAAGRVGEALDSRVRRAGAVALVVALVAVFVLDVALPDVVLLPFLAVPPVAAATFLRPRGTASIGALACGLGLLAALPTGSLGDDDYWVRLAGLLVVCLVAVQLARLATARQLALASREQRYRLLADNATDAIFLTDLDWTVTWVSPTVTTELGHPAVDVVGRPRTRLVDAADRHTAEAAQRRTAAGEPTRHEERFLLGDGRSRWMSVAARPHRDDGGTVTGFVCALRDIDDEVRYRHALDRRERMFRFAMAGAAHGMAVIALDGRFLEVNGMLAELVGRDTAWLLEHSEDDLFAGDGLEQVHQSRERLVAGLSTRESHLRRFVDAHGRERWLNHGVGLVDDGVGPQLLVCQYQDVTAAHVEQLELAGRVNRDQLTGVASRSHLLDVLTHTDWRDHRRGIGVALLTCDVDGFSAINDTWGRGVGDDVLRIVADRLTLSVREDDVVGRMGGDRFVVVLRGVDDVDDACSVAEKIRAAVAQPIVVGGRTLLCRISVGVSQLAYGDTPADSLRHAEAALLQAQVQGGDRVSRFQAGRARSSAVPAGPVVEG